MNAVADAMNSKGWAALSDVPGLSDWVQHVRPIAVETAQDPAHRAAWLRHGETWFAGVNVLGNTSTGAVAGGPDLPEALVRTLTDLSLPTVLDQGQLSVVYPGYPRQDPGESEAAHRFRRNRDAAHVDGLLPVGPNRRRHLHEPHAYVLGIPLTEVGAGTSPLVVWEGSQDVMRAGFKDALQGVPPEQWGEVDLTDIYQSLRRQVFEDCPRVEVSVEPGQATLVHRCAVHGVAPWERGAKSPKEGRMIVYFRPELPDISLWLAEG